MATRSRLAAGDDRVRTRSPLAILLGTPAVGALIGAVAVASLFLVFAPAFRSFSAVGTIAYQAATIGIMAVFVALLMIGGEFDLSTGVAVTTSGLTAAHTTWYFGLNVWVGVLRRPRRSRWRSGRSTAGCCTRPACRASS